MVGVVRCQWHPQWALNCLCVSTLPKPTRELSGPIYELEWNQRTPRDNCICCAIQCAADLPACCCCAGCLLLLAAQRRRQPDGVLPQDHGWACDWQGWRYHQGLAAQVPHLHPGGFSGAYDQEGLLGWGGWESVAAVCLDRQTWRADRWLGSTGATGAAPFCVECACFCTCSHVTAADQDCSHDSCALSQIAAMQLGSVPFNQLCRAVVCYAACRLSSRVTP